MKRFLGGMLVILSCVSFITAMEQTPEKKEITWPQEQDKETLFAKLLIAHGWTIELVPHDVSIRSRISWGYLPLVMTFQAIKYTSPTYIVQKKYRVSFVVKVGENYHFDVSRIIAKITETTTISEDRELLSFFNIITDPKLGGLYRFEASICADLIRWCKLSFDYEDDDCTIL